jgi:hypothetical protein
VRLKFNIFLASTVYTSLTFLGLIEVLSIHHSWAMLRKERGF